MCNDGSTCTTDACHTTNDAAVSIPTAAIANRVNFAAGTGSNASPDYINYFGTSSFTIEGWIYTAGGAAASTGVFRHGRQGDFAQVVVQLGGTGNLQLLGSVEADTAGADQVDVTSPTVLVANTWNHFALVVDRSGGQQLRLIVNGGTPTVASGALWATSAISSTDQSMLGVARDATGALTLPFAGRLDEIRIWNFARTQAQIAADMNREIEAASGLVHRWSFNAGTGTTAADAVGEHQRDSRRHHHLEHDQSPVRGEATLACIRASRTARPAATAMPARRAMSATPACAAGRRSTATTGTPARRTAAAADVRPRAAGRRRLVLRRQRLHDGRHLLQRVAPGQRSSATTAMRARPTAARRHVRLCQRATNGTTAATATSARPATSCTNGTCGGTPLNCDDGNSCTTDSCTAGTCGHANLANGTTCSDGTACTTGDACSSGTCVGTALNCDDSNPCTTDSCHPVTGCVQTNNTATCASDGNPCTDDVCAGGSCTHPNDNSNSCTDGNGCTGDACVSGACSSWYAPTANCCASNANCNDGVAGTTDTCVGPPNGTCSNVVTGGCTTAAQCNDGNGCTTDACVGAVGGSALNFDGVDDNVTMGTALGLNSATFTLEGWIKKDGASWGTANATTGGGGSATSSR
jgi:hypothetical protein